jgi:methylamine dehydrogenase accessory protein MauD
MNAVLLVSTLVLWLVVLFLAFLLLGTLRAMARLSWRLDQWEAINPRRLGRDGLKVGQAAPDFALPAADGREVALHDFTGRRVVLVFTQSGCSPCNSIVPELNRLQRRGAVQILAVNNGEAGATRQSTAQTGATFPVLIQEKFSVSKRYQVFATPFAFVIDEKGFIVSKGLVDSRQHLGFVLAGDGVKEGHREAATDEPERGDSPESVSITSREVSHV